MYRTSVGRIERHTGILTKRRAIRARVRIPMDPDKTEYSITEAAAIKKVRRSTIHTAIQTGRLPAHTEQTGAARVVWKIRREDLEAWTPMDRQESGRRGAAIRYGKKDPDHGG